MVHIEHNTECIHKSIDSLCVGNSTKVESQCVHSGHIVFTQCAYSKRTVKRFLFIQSKETSSYTLARSLVCDCLRQMGFATFFILCAKNFQIEI